MNQASCPGSRGHAHCGRFIAFLFLIGAATAAESPVAEARSRTGTITGSVSNSATGQNLEGAEVTLLPGGLSALTTRDGRYEIPDVAAGTYTLTATYAGLEARSLPAVVTAGAVVTRDFGLSSSVYQLDKFVVEGEREGNALAITERRNAGNVKDVISSDAFGNVADLNLGNFLQRMPGISKEESEGEIYLIRIRGVDSNMNAVSIDGTRGANGTTRSLNRGFEIDKVPADFIETIEVTKAATPDMDADSIGGSVNLKTKSALDRKGRRATYNVGHTYNLDQKSFRPLVSLSYSDIIRERVGILVTASYNESHKPRDRSNLLYEQTTATDRPVFFTAANWGQDQLKHKRQGAGVRFDYRLGDATKVYFNTTYSYYVDQLNRRQPTVNTATATNIVSVTSTVTETRNQTFTFNQNRRERDVRTLNYTIGGENSRFLGGKVDFTANYSPSQGDERRFIPARAVAGVGFRFDRSATHNYFTVAQISGPDIYDPRNSTMTSLDLPEIASHDEIVGAQVNYRKAWASVLPLSLKTGFRYREQTRKRDQTRNLYSYVGPNGVAGPVGTANDDDLGRFFDPGYTHVAFSYPRGLQFMKLPELMEALRSQPQLFRRNVATSTQDTIRNDTRAEETVTALYLQGETRWGRLNLVTGVRLEETSFSASGYKQELTAAERARRAAWVGTVTDEETARRNLAEYGNPTRGEGDYRNTFPSVHLKYNATRNLIGRLSYSTGIGRPNFGQIIPTMTINNDNLTITSNNPDLQPQRSKNLDLSLEYYFEPAGLFSVGAFEKKLSNFIYRASVGRVDDSNNIFGQEYEGYLLTTDRNGGSATIRGLEFSYNQQFSNLRGFWRGFGVFANLTWLRTQGDYGTPGANNSGRTIPLFTPRTGNAGISYLAHGWTVRAKVNYSSDRLESYNADASRRVYDKGSTPVDFNLAYAFSRRFSVYADVINVFNVGTNHQFTYIKDRMTRNDLYTTVIKFGFSGSY
ncbi:MAG: TonB-dependent receptor [Verrucomicrobia bacterium]|nr:TonB-dependent receptor [Verrucomicrobiota bacterium]